MPKNKLTPEELREEWHKYLHPKDNSFRLPSEKDVADWWIEKIESKIALSNKDLVERILPMLEKCATATDGNILFLKVDKKQFEKLLNSLSKEEDAK